VAAAVEPELRLVVADLEAVVLLLVLLVVLVILQMVAVEVAELPQVLPQLQELLAAVDQEAI
jgi:hypothetical protein